MTCWGPLQTTLALGECTEILLQVNGFPHVQNCIPNNKLWAVFARGGFVPISNDNFQQNLIYVLLNFRLLMYIIYSMETTMIIPACSYTSAA